MENYEWTHPGVLLKEQYLEPNKITVTRFAKAIGLNRANASKLLNGHAGISADMAYRLAAAFKTSPDLWLNIQKRYELKKAESNKRPEIEVLV